jgi:hypothetical protein
MAIDFMNMFAPRGAPSGLDALFNEDQRRLMGRNANLSAAAALLAASGPSRQRVGLGQALGSALQAGQQGYQQARAGSLQDLLLGEKLREGQTARTRQANIEGIINTGIRPATPGMPAQMVEEDGRFMGETPAVAARPAGFDFQAIAPQLMAQGPEGRKAFGELLAAQKTLMGDTFSLAEGTKQYQRDPITGVVTEIAAGAPKREPVPSEIQAYQLAQDQGFTGSFVDFKNALRPPTAPPSAVAEYQFAVGQGYKGTFEQFNQAQRRAIAPKTTVDMTGGQKGFENEMKLGSSFKQEPIYKDFSDMKSAFSQVVSSLSQGTPIGDVAGATKIMKLLDPGSVVRESELAIAMEASGRMDRLQNYFSNMMSGQKLTPTQRDDFKALANELYAAAGQAYNAKRGEYEQFGNAYGFKNLGTALGPAANIPSLVRRLEPTTSGSQKKRRDLNDIFFGGPQ